MTGPEAAEVTVVNADSWLARTAQLAILLSRAVDGGVIPDPVGHPADPRRIIALRGLTFWSANSNALRDALSYGGSKSRLPANNVAAELGL